MTAYRRGDLDEWVSIFATAVRDAADIGTALLRRLDAVPNHLHDQVSTRGDSATRRLLDDLVRHPAVTSSDVVDWYDVTQARASQILNRLADGGVLRRSELAAGRADVWVAPDVISVLDSLNQTPRHTIDPASRSTT